MSDTAEILERVPAPSIPGTVVLAPDQERLQRRVILIITIVPFVGFLGALLLLWGHGLTGTDFGIFAATYLATGLGITIGYHRLFTHRSFEAMRPLRIALAVSGSMAVEGSVISWVANHRRHHAYADKAGDPHSPHLDVEEGVRGIAKGLWHAHVGWLFSKEKTAIDRWAPDLLKDPAMRTIDRLFPVWVVLSFVVPAALGLVLTRSLWGATTAFVWGSLARIFMLHHVTWSINSICHYYGRRPFATTDESTNNWLLSLISFGESWHNNHHAFPSSAVHGIGKWQVDISAAIIGFLERLGIVRHVKRVTSKQIEKKRD